MTEDQLSKTQKDWLYDLRANFKIEKSVEMAIYNVLVDTESGVLSDVEFVQVLNVFTGWALPDHQPAFAVGEYYSFTTYRKDYDADTTFIFKTLETKNSGIRVIEYDFHGKELGEYVYDSDSEFLKGSKTATAEQIATFKRAEHFASKGREWSEFRKGDIVQNTKTMQLGLVESVDEDGDAWVNYNIDKPLIYPSCCKCTGALFLNLIQTAEELQEVAEDE